MSDGVRRPLIAGRASRPGPRSPYSRGTSRRTRRSPPGHGRRGSSCGSGLRRGSSRIGPWSLSSAGVRSWVPAGRTRNRPGCVEIKFRAPQDVAPDRVGSMAWRLTGWFPHRDRRRRRGGPRAGERARVAHTCGVAGVGPIEVTWDGVRSPLRADGVKSHKNDPLASVLQTASRHVGLTPHQTRLPLVVRSGRAWTVDALLTSPSRDSRRQAPCIDLGIEISHCRLSSGKLERAVVTRRRRTS